jgi:hypothetical protein
MHTEIRAALAAGTLVPYLGPGVLALGASGSALPQSPEALARHLTASVSVPHKLRGNLTGAAQFIENFKHRKTVTSLMRAAFAADAAPSALHRFLAAQRQLPLIVNAWYDDVMQKALAGRNDWGMVQGLSQAEHFGRWTRCYAADGAPVEGEPAWMTLLYQPIGSVSPAANFLVSDSDYVEVLTEIDIQTPIPDAVKHRRAGRHFLFLGCRFSTQLERAFAFQIMKRSSARHWAVLPEPPTRNEARFLATYGVERIAAPLADFAAELAGSAEPVAA